LKLSCCICNTMATDEWAALRNWELQNGVKPMEMEEIFKFDENEHMTMLERKAWLSDPHYFKHVKMSAVALLKMVMHACSGGTLEIMGMMLGKVVGDTIVVLDSFSLPVVGTETRVNPGAEADGYMIDYTEANAALGRGEKTCGWYHSHPGYGCWLSGIDVATQIIQQQQGPFLAVVVDPTRTISAGRVEIGAFRTYPKDYKPSAEAGRKYQSIPTAKIEDFGTHADRYYSLDISYFKSSLDSKLLELLWHKYWINTLSSSPLVANRDYNIGQIRDMAQKFHSVDPQYFEDKRNCRESLKNPDNALARSATESALIVLEHMHSVIAMALKHCLFDPRSTEMSRPTEAATAAAADDKTNPPPEKKPATEEKSVPSSLTIVRDTVELARKIEQNQKDKKMA